MPHTNSAKKRLRQSVRRTAKNKSIRSSVRTHERKILAKVAAGDRAGAEAMLSTLYQQLDKAARAHVMHANTAANHKSRLARAVKRGAV